MRCAVLQCGPQPWPAEARKHPAFARRAPQAASESPTDLLCHSERSEESFPLRTKGRLRTMPCKEEKDKRSAVKNLFWARLQILRRSSDLLRMTMLSCIESFPFGNSFKCSPGPAAGVALSARAGPGRKVFRIRKRTEPAEHTCHNCHSERSGRLRTIPSKEEKDKRSAVKHLYADDTDSSSLYSSE